MSRRVWVVVALCLCSDLALSAAADQRPDKRTLPPLPPRHGGPAYVPSEVLVKFREHFDRNAFQAQVGVAPATTADAVKVFHSHFMTKPDRAPVLGWQRVKLPDGQRVEDALSILSGNALVENVEPNYRVHAAALSTTYTPLAGPNDPYYNEGSPSRTLWWFNRNKADVAYNQSYSWLGSMVVVAVVDTGLQGAHPDLAGRTITGYSAVSYTASTEDDNMYLYGPLQPVLGHGTHSAGIIAANANNGAGVAGTGYRTGVRVMPVKVLDYAASGTVADLAEGVQWATDHGARVINMSLGIYGSNPTVLQTACANAIAAGRILVAAAGNNNVNLTTNPYYPAVYNGVVAVAATDAQDYVTYYSNWGAGMIDVAAPGGALEMYHPSYDRDYGITTTAMGSTYSAVDGTSFSAPQISALAALLWLKDPGLSYTTVRSILTSAGSCQNPLGESSIYIGAGRISVAAALAYNTPSPTPTLTETPTVTPTPTITQTSTLTPTSTVSATLTVTPIVTPTPTIAQTSTVTPTDSQTPTAPPSITITPTFTPTPTTSPSITVTPTFTATVTASCTATVSSTPPHTATATSTATPTPWLEEGKLVAYPNPGREYVNFTYTISGTVQVTIDIFSVSGERVAQIWELNQGNAGQTLTTRWDCSAVAPGVYLARIVIRDAAGEVLINQTKKVAVVH